MLGMSVEHLHHEIIVAHIVRRTLWRRKNLDAATSPEVGLDAFAPDDALDEVQIGLLEHDDVHRLFGCESCAALFQRRHEGSEELP